MLDYSQHQDWSFPVPITYGPGRIKELSRLCLEQGMTKPFLVTDKGSANLPFIADIMADLNAAGMDVSLYADISPNPRDEEIMAGRQSYLDGGMMVSLPLVVAAAWMAAKRSLWWLTMIMIYGRLNGKRRHPKLIRQNRFHH
ncbi:MAG: iron-containing alcohol dehydrogenase [Candidatus Puniceispirillales bacterium]